MNKIFLSFLALALLGGALTPAFNTALANKAGGAKTRLPNTLKGDKQPDDKSAAPDTARLV